MKNILKSELGVSLVEYALCISLVSLIAVIALPGPAIQIRRVICEEIIGSLSPDKDLLHFLQYEGEWTCYDEGIDTQVANPFLF